MFVRAFLASSRPLLSRIRPNLAAIARQPHVHVHAPNSIQSPLLARGMKVRASVKLMCDGCSFVRRKGRIYVICNRNAKHKQRQG